MSWEDILKIGGATDFVLDFLQDFKGEYFKSNSITILDTANLANESNRSFNDIKQSMLKNWNDSHWSELLAKDNNFMDKLESNGFALSDVDWEEVNTQDKERFFFLLEKEMQR